MKIETVVTGTLDENCYVLIKDKTCLVVDPGDDYSKIKDVVGDNKVLGVLLTHSHFDHIGALRNFLTKRSVKIFKMSNLEEKEYEIGSFKFNCIYTPGHSKDSVTFFFKDDMIMFVGDFIFKDSIGRCDLPGGSQSEMQDSIKLIKEFDPEIIVYPGHGDSATLGDEFTNNIFFR